MAARRIDALSRFFAKSNFFEDETARTALLERLAAVRERWAGMTWDAIRAEISA
jgi:hypothetical protein